MESELSCPICFEYYNDPVLLPCAHSFCRQCLRTIFSVKLEQAESKLELHVALGRSWRPGNVLVPCPSCRKEVDLCSDDIDSMQSNFLLSNIVRKYKDSMTATKEALLSFDVARTSLNSNGDYVSMSPHYVNTKADEESIENENPYVTMEGRRSRYPVNKADATEDYYEYVEPAYIHRPYVNQPEHIIRRPPTLPKRRMPKQRSFSESFAESGESFPSPAPISVVDRGYQLNSQIQPTLPKRSAEEKPRRKSIFDLADEVASQASNMSITNTSNGKSRPKRSSQSFDKRHSSIPARGEGTSDWRFGAIRRKSQSDILESLKQSKAMLRLQSANDGKVISTDARPRIRDLKQSRVEEAAVISTDGRPSIRDLKQSRVEEAADIVESSNQSKAVLRLQSANDGKVISTDGRPRIRDLKQSRVEEAAVISTDGRPRIWDLKQSRVAEEAAEIVSKRRVSAPPVPHPKPTKSVIERVKRNTFDNFKLDYTTIREGE